ncbi:hypothetical protein [Paludibaculum fermentans]|uniref:WxL domain-containing protein n=1 Tax=Paludibaculum fermentans TaxID=1473598 RepID=A0A7S7NMZ3_PALFE|nr:hypothetical protein [Paludibaculum fermentans]QOY86570.1 hypothetical protein IRI77_27785 [Paludibaculum fermentans]
MKKTLAMAATIVMMLTATAGAQTANTGSLALTGQVDGSIILSFHQNTSGGFTLTSGDGTAAAGANLSTVSMYGTATGIVAGSNFVKTNQVDGFTLSGPMDVQVDKANITSSGYTLSAQLTSSDSSEWSLGGASLNSTSPVVVVSEGSYAARTPLTLSVKFPTSMNSGSVSNTINFVATAQ